MTALVLVACSVAAAPSSKQRDAEIQVPLLTFVDGGVAGKSSRVTARVIPQRAALPSVGILATSASVSGDQWLPTLWQAAFVATGATGSSLLDFEFTLRVPEPALDPSAGMLAASTLTALIRGKTLVPRTSMTGALNPDGSVGPVDDVLTRLRAAAADGVKRFGFPLGARQQPDGAGAMVDLLVEGQRLGLEVKELTGLDDAYLFLTGDVLPRPAPAAESEMELWPVELTALSRITAEVRHELETERVRLDAALDGGTAASKAQLDRAVSQATDFERSGDPVRALVVWSSTLSSTRAAVQDALLVRALTARDSETALSLLEAQEQSFPAEQLALRKEIDARFPNTTRANDTYAMDLLESVVTQGAALDALEDAKALRSMDPQDPSFARKLRLTAEALLRGREELRNGRRFFALYASLPKLKKPLPPLDAAWLATSYASAAAASRAAFDSRLTESQKKDATFVELAGYEALLRSETDARARLVLAARQSIYSAHLVNTTTALGAQVDEKGVFSLRNTRALSVQLEQARARVLQSCGRAKRELGLIPFAARIRYLSARAAREGSDRQKTESLAELWISNWWCEVAVSRGR